jgi:hypothetical protein
MRRSFLIVVAVALVAATGVAVAVLGLSAGGSEPRHRSVVRSHPHVTSAPRTNCMSAPSACGYPDMTNTGAPRGATFTDSGSITISKPGEVVSGLNVTGVLTIDAPNVTVKSSVITNCDNRGFAILNMAGANGTVIEDTTLKGANNGRCALSAGVQNGAGPITLERVQAYNVDSAFHGVGTLRDSYFLDNAEIPGEHYEPIFHAGGDGSPLVVDHNTLLNPHQQTAAVFVTDYNGAVGRVSITNNLMAGGGFTIYGGTDQKAPVTGPFTVTGNRFARCLSRSCPDAHGYWRKGGFWGLAAYLNSAVTTWNGNYWDDNLLPAKA